MLFTGSRLLHKSAWAKIEPVLFSSEDVSRIILKH